MSSLDRAYIYQLIDGECDYQNKIRPKTNSIGDYLTLLRYEGRLADAACTASIDGQASLNVIRKIAGIAVCCMEEHGAPARQGYEPPASSDVADPSKVYVLFRKNLFVQAYSNKIDAHLAAANNSERDGDPIDDFHVEFMPLVPDSGLRIWKDDK